MFASFLIIAFVVGLYWASRRVSPIDNKVVTLVMAAFGLRLVLSLFLPEIPFFSHGVGSDAPGYVLEGHAIARIWDYESFHYVTGEEIPQLTRTSLPQHLFGAIDYLNGGESILACEALVAFLACLACLNIFALAVEFGAPAKAALTVLVALLFLPSFLFYTSDTYKDGIVQFLVVAIGGSALRLSRRFSIKHLAVALVCMAALSVTRSYMVYAAVVPLALGLLGLRSGSVVRTFLALLALFLVLVTVAATGTGDAFVEDATATYEHGTSQEMHEAEASGGSSVQLEGSGAATFALALVYTLFAPFVWQSGSLGFQLGKIDCLAWYVIAYHAAKGVTALWKTRKTELLILLSFIVPTTFVYAAAFANVGLTVRERLGVVMMSALLAAMGKGAGRETQTESTTSASTLSDVAGRIGQEPRPV